MKILAICDNMANWMQTTQHELSVPERIARYVLFHEISRGGMGTVYLARTRTSRRGFRRVVALKRLHPERAIDERFRRMFLDEVRLISQLSHPNIGSALDFGEEDGTVFLTMPYIVGESLDRVMAALSRAPRELQGRIPALTARILIDVCEGLHAAHELRGPSGELLEVVHRDVTPRNVIVGYEGITRVIDFGVASALSKQDRTATGEFKGTPGYAAPEHVQGRPVDRRADIWSLGVLGWELSTGRRLFARKDVLQALDAVLHAPIQGPAEVNPTLPIGLDELIMCALNRDPARRFSSAREMGRELLLFLHECERPMGAAEVAECMELLFPGVHAAQRKLVEEVRARELPPSSRSKRQGREAARPAVWPLVTAAGAAAAVTYTLMRLFG